MKRFYTWAIVTGLCYTTSLPVALAQGNGKGNEKKEAAAEKRDEKDNDNNERRQHRPTRIKDFVEQKKAEAEANRGKSNGNGKANKPEKNNNDGENKGNAYGKNKGELSGREFGQARAAAAKQNGQQKRAVLTKTVTDGDAKVTEARGRLSRAIEELERKRKAGSVTDSEYNEKKVTISRTEKAIQVLKEKINAAKELVSAPVVE